MVLFNNSSQQLPCEALYARLSPSRSNQLVGYGGRDGAVHVYPFSSFSSVARLDGLSAPVTSLAFDPDQRNVVGGSDTGGLQLWDVATEQVVRTFGKGHTSTITDVEVHKSGQFVATVSTDTNLRIWDVRKSSGLQSYKNAKAPLCAVQFSPNGKWVATGCAAGIVRLYNLTTAKTEGSLQIHTGAITSLHFHPELYYLAVGSGDGTLSVWNLETFQPEFRSKGMKTPIDSVLFCGSRLIAASDHTVHLYDMANLGDRTAQTVEAPWTMISDMVYVSYAEEAWFVEASGSTVLTGKMAIGQQWQSLQEHVDPQSSDPHSPAAAATTPMAVKSVPAPINNVTAAEPLIPAVASPPARIGRKMDRRGSADTKPDRLVPGKKGVLLENYVVEKPRSSGNSSPYSSPASIPPYAGPTPQPLVAPTVKESVSESEMASELVATSSTVAGHLHRRLTHLRVIRSLWQQDQRAALQHLRRAATDGTEGGAVLDFLTAMQQQRMKEKITMDVLPDLLGIVEYALHGTDDVLLVTALRVLRSMNTKFRARVEEGQRRARSSQSNGYNDPLGMNNWPSAMSKLGECSWQVLALSDRNDVVGDEAKQLIAEMPPPPRKQ